MTRDRQRRTSSGSTLRLVAGAAGEPGTAEPTRLATPRPAAVPTAVPPADAADAADALDAADAPSAAAVEVPRPAGPVVVPDAGVFAGPTGDLASLVLPGQRQSVAVGRHWVVRTAVEYGVTGMASQVAELLSSELLANAVLHGASGGAVGIQVWCAGDVLRVSVSDGGDTAPVVLRHELSAPNGRGMAIVEAMCSRWGVDHHDDGGKTVWFELFLSDY